MAATISEFEMMEAGAGESTHVAEKLFVQAQVQSSDMPTGAAAGAGSKFSQRIACISSKIAEKTPSVSSISGAGVVAAGVAPKAQANGMSNEVNQSAASDFDPAKLIAAVNGDVNPGCTPGKALDTNYICLYLCSMTTFALIWQTFHDIGLSTLLTFAVLIQVMALCALLMAVHVRKSVAGLSLKSMCMQGLSFFLRLCSTSWLKGYIPVDSTGDWLYQFADFCALCLCLQLAYLVSVTYRRSYQAEQDSFAAPQVVVFCFLLAVLVHPDLNNRPFFDAIWTASLYVDVVSTLPQLWMIGKIGGKVDALSAHYVFLIAVSRFVDMIFWYYGFEELAPENGGFNLAGWVVLGAHLVHLLLMWDFIFCYVRSTFLKGEIGNKTLDFSEMMGVMDQV